MESVAHWGPRMLPNVVLQGIDGGRTQRGIALATIFGFATVAWGGVAAAGWLTHRVGVAGGFAVGVAVTLVGIILGRTRVRVARSVLACRLREQPATIVAIDVVRRGRTLVLDGNREFLPEPEGGPPGIMERRDHVWLRFVGGRRAARLSLPQRDVPHLLAYLFETLAAVNPACSWGGHPIRALIESTQPPMPASPPAARRT